MAGEVFESLAIPLMKLVWLKTSEMESGYSPHSSSIFKDIIIWILPKTERDLNELAGSHVIKIPSTAKDKGSNLYI
ncbi:hypothetical protein F2Q69_00005616 [Brassica cretica]|uniref:Uncharacterized protein n=1 Tax=Brassica cretica TaxID=69181 RepID=A0A8S9NZG9_BRACR|nr:hypothetical protein F2Q69_00005616 [Brassica cretica]